MRTAAALLITLSLAACQKDVEPEKPKGPPQPDDVIAVASVRSLAETTGRAAQYVEAVRPGSGAVVTAKEAASALALAVGAASIDGIALDKPLHVIVLDPKKHPRPLVLLGTGDPAKLQPGGTAIAKGQDGRALIGDKAAVEMVAQWAFGSLAAQEAPVSLTVRASLRKLVERYRAEIEQGKQAMSQGMGAASPAMSKIVEVEIDLLLRLASQTDEMRAVFDANATEAWFELGFTPTPGSGFEAFNKAQRPAAAAQLTRLPATPSSSMLMAASYELGPLRGVLYDLMGPMVATWAGVPADDAFRKRWDAMLGHFAGPIAMSMTTGPDLKSSMQQLLDVDDGPKTMAAIKALFPWNRPTTIDMAGIMKAQLTPRQAAATHDGVAIDQMAIRFDLSSMPAPEQQMMRMMYGEEMVLLVAGFDKYLAMTTGPNALPDMQRTIDMVRRGPAVALPSGGKAAFDAAAGRKSSYVIFMNMASAMAAATGRTVQTDTGVAMELLFPEGRAALRFGMPAAHVRAIMGSFPQ
jgi:hypothetical protein